MIPSGRLPPGESAFVRRALGGVVLLVCILVLPAPWLSPIESAAAVKLSFIGAAGGVGGSAYLLETDEGRTLVDCGLFPGEGAQGRNARLAFDPRTLDAVILTHAHSDHAGRIPMLVKGGFRGPILATDATRRIAADMLRMSLAIGSATGADLYGRGDLDAALRSIRTASLDVVERLPGGVEVRLRDAGHVAGSAFAEVRTRGREDYTVVFSGDLGRTGSPLHCGPSPLGEADYVLVESTYGGRRRPPVDFAAFGVAVRDTLAAGGSVLIPAPVLEKTQSVLAVIGSLKRSGVIAREVPVYVDSRSAQRLNAVYRAAPECSGAGAAARAPAAELLSFPGLREVSQREALRHHASGEPAIYVSSSGMLDHAGSPKHLAAMAEDARNLLAIVGWQAPDTVGRKLQEGATTVEIPIERFAAGGRPDVELLHRSVRMKVRTFTEFSTHADGCEILGWLSRLRSVRRVFVVHGERPGAEKLAGLIATELGVPASVPDAGDVVVLGRDPKVPLRTRGTDLCGGLESAGVPVREGLE
jgi:metallo-beta-lactamase family protein